LVLIKGHGLKLSHGDGTEHVLANVYDQATFPGDVGTHATLTSGPVLDFNIITDRATFRSVVTVMRDAKKKRVAAIATVLAIFAVDNELLITDPDKDRHRLQKGDLLLVDAPELSDWIVTGGTAIVTQLLQIHKG
jgi:environmental stress-induced protein Ves